jgi:hypothetical protein
MGVSCIDQLSLEVLYEFDRDAHVFKRVHGGANVKVLDVKTHVFSAFSGDCAIPEAF